MTKWDGWHGLLEGRRTDDAELRPLRPHIKGTVGGSGAFCALASDNNRYWVKPLDNLQGQRVVITEQVVGRAGALIGAPVCTVRTIEITDDHAGWEFRNGRALSPGIAHASLEVPGATDTRQFEQRNADDNIRRYVGYAVLYEWCWGGDSQGLHSTMEDFRFYSHDHGWFLPPEGSGWSIAALTANVHEPHEFPNGFVGTPRDVLTQYACRLDELSRGDLVGILSMIPQSWPVTDEELECVGWFLERRARMVAARLRGLPGGAQ